MEHETTLILVGSDEEFLNYKSREVIATNKLKKLEYTAFSVRERSFKELIGILGQGSLLGREEFIWVHDGGTIKNRELNILKEYLRAGILRKLLITSVEKKENVNRWQSFDGIKNVKVRLYSENHFELFIKEIEKIARKNGKLITKVAAESLLKKCNGSFGTAIQELYKLCSYFADKKEIASEDVETYVCEQPQSKLFGFIEAFLQRDIPLSTKRLEEVLACGEKPEAVFYVLLSTMYNFVKAITLFKLRRNEDEVAKLTGLQKWQARNYKKHSVCWEWEKLVDVYWKLLVADFRIKTGMSRDLKIILKKIILEGAI